METTSIISIVSVIINLVLVFLLAIRFKKDKEEPSTPTTIINANIDQSKSIIDVAGKKYSLGELSTDGKHLTFRDINGNSIITFSGKLIEG